MTVRHRFRPVFLQTALAVAALLSAVSLPAALPAQALAAGSLPAGGEVYVSDGGSLQGSRGRSAGRSAGTSEGGSGGGSEGGSWQRLAAYAPPWSWPLEPPPTPVRRFDLPLQPWLAGHRGVDLAAAEGTTVLAPAAGRVVFAGWVVNRPVLSIDHGGGLRSSFEPVQASVTVGQMVGRGSPIGVAVSVDEASGLHCRNGCLHWGVRLQEDYVNPLNYVTDRRPSVLLPVSMTHTGHAASYLQAAGQPATLADPPLRRGPSASATGPGRPHAPP